jgi:hypothetical protein
MKQEEHDYLIKYYLHLLPLEAKVVIKYPYLSQTDMQTNMRQLSKMIIENHSNEVFWNLCPKCEKLARTPFAQQCRFCQHDWH